MVLANNSHSRSNNTNMGLSNVIGYSHNRDNASSAGLWVFWAYQLLPDLQRLLLSFLCGERGASWRKLFYFLEAVNLKFRIVMAADPVWQT